jgi:2-methylisocitrate lyase-like PEP mutase family enzyme
MSATSVRAQRLLDLHTAPELLILVNAWDALTARIIAAAGAPALATASHSIADAHGYPDGEQIPVDLMVAAVGRIAGCVDIPVSADLESGYGDAGAVVAASIEAGAVGANLEDDLVPVDRHAAAIAAARAAGDAAGIHFVINARTDEFLKGGRSVDEAIGRGRAYLDAGADCVFVPAALDPADIASLGEAFDGRLSLIAHPKAPPLVDLAGLGVARISTGPGTAGVAITAINAFARDLLAGGAYPDELTARM